MEHIIEKDFFDFGYKVVEVTTDYTLQQRYKTIKVFNNVSDAIKFEFKRRSRENTFHIITVDYKVRVKNGN